MSAFDFAVIDLETTGISPAKHHRVIEIAVVHVDGSGQLHDEWSSLINPKRHVSATEVHGISAVDLFDAPTFCDIAGDLVERLRGKVLVAHNLRFDSTFLRSEFERIGVAVPITPECGLCTMQLASEYLSTARRSLEACCAAIGYQLRDAHSALEDARAAAHLLGHYLRETPGFAQDVANTISRLAPIEWPLLDAYGVAPVTRCVGPKPPREHFLAKLASRVDGCADNGAERSYHALLDRILLDREIGLHEEAELIMVAATMGIAGEDAVRFNHRYLEALARIAHEDGITTPDEREDLHLVAHLLGVETSAVDDLLDRSVLPPDLSDTHGTVRSFSLQTGDVVVFTGEAPNVTRDDLRSAAKGLGIDVASSVSKKTRLVVAEDPDSLSGKAQKARLLGIPIVGYATYFRMIEKLSL